MDKVDIHYLGMAQGATVYEGMHPDMSFKPDIEGEGGIGTHYNEDTHGKVLASMYDINGCWHYITNKGHIGYVSVRGIDIHTRTMFITLNPLCVWEIMSVLRNGLRKFDTLEPWYISELVELVKAVYNINGRGERL